ncbi:MAG: four helix bundle protein [bacterium]
MDYNQLKTKELSDRTKIFALRIIKLVQALPDNQVSYIIGKQILRSGTSVGANYRASCRARSTAEFVSKLGIVAEEADETLYWLELLVESGQMCEDRLAGLMKETNEIISIIVSSIKTSKRKAVSKSK